MRFHLFDIQIRFSLWFFAVAACAALLQKGPLLYYFVLPIATHELGHLLVMAVLGVQIEEIAFTPVSLAIRRKQGRMLSYGGEVAVSLGGVAANLLMAFFLYRFAFQSMRTTLLLACNVAVAVFNLLPVGSLDGGQVLRHVSSRFFSLRVADILSRVISFVVLTPMTAVAVLVLLRQKGNFTLLLVCVYLTVTLVLRAE